MNTENTDTRQPTLVIALLICGILMAGCGQKGPLFLPDEEESAQEKNR